MRSTEEYINELPEEFRNKFDYSKSVYTGLKEPFNYVCPIHGQVTMKAGKHSISMHGCNLCATNEGIKTKSGVVAKRFFKKCEDLYGDSIDFSNSVYLGMKTPLTAVCKKHGTFSALPIDIQRYQPCMSCKKEAISPSRKPTEIVIAESKEKFGLSFEFDFTDYRSCTSIIPIKCPVHGWFEDKLSNHLASKLGCRSCWIESEKSVWNRISPEDSLRQLKDMYGDLYKFFGEDIDKGKGYVRYYCTKHKTLKMTALRHLRLGYACNQCGDEVMAEKLTGFYTKRLIERDKDIFIEDYNNLYVMSLGEDLIKVGIAKHLTARRPAVEAHSGLKTEYLYTKPMNTYDAFYLEQELHAMLKPHRYFSPTTWSGHTEVFLITDDQKSDLIEYIENYNE